MNHPYPTRIGLVKIGVICASRFLLNLFLRSNTGDFYLDKTGGKQHEEDLAIRA